MMPLLPSDQLIASQIAVQVRLPSNHALEPVVSSLLWLYSETYRKNKLTRKPVQASFLL